MNELEMFKEPILPKLRVDEVMGRAYGTCSNYKGSNYQTLPWCTLFGKYTHSFVCENCKEYEIPKNEK